MCRRRTRGYTMVELVAVIAIVGVLAAVAIPRLAGRAAFDARAFYDLSQAVVRHAQKVAIAQRRVVYVDVSATRIAACYDAACASRVRPPLDYLQPSTPSGAAHAPAAHCGNDPGWLCAGAPDGVTAGPAVQFTFDGLGRPSLAAQQVITVTGDVVRAFAVERETGYVHP